MLDQGGRSAIGIDLWISGWTLLIAVMLCRTGWVKRWRSVGWDCWGSSRATRARAGWRTSRRLETRVGELSECVAFTLVLSSDQGLHVAVHHCYWHCLPCIHLRLSPAHGGTHSYLLKGEDQPFFNVCHCHCTVKNVYIECSAFLHIRKE